MVRHFCFEVIAQLGKNWSARTFRDRISVKLYESGFLKLGTKIGRSTATYYLRSIGMVLVHPKKGIYKDGHERPDTVAYRKIYTSVLKEFQHRKTTYVGKDLQIENQPQLTSDPVAIRVYHDECIYASHEGVIQLWVHEGVDGKYKKPRGEIVMASGFICRYKHCHST
jgi:hypothetical protein